VPTAGGEEERRASGGRGGRGLGAVGLGVGELGVRVNI
jgi:hypothetical protein